MSSVTTGAVTEPRTEHGTSRADRSAKERRPQIGLLNAIVTFFGANPVSWLQLQTANINDMLLMVILVWLQAGFAMVLLSAALKAVPEETLEAARIDGANEVQIFFQVIVPQIWPTVITVFVTIVILVMKIFDVVYVTKGGNFGTNVMRWSSSPSSSSSVTTAAPRLPSSSS